VNGHCLIIGKEAYYFGDIILIELWRIPIKVFISEHNLTIISRISGGGLQGMDTPNDFAFNYRFCSMVLTLRAING